MSIDWLNIRPLNGSQRTAFEELCCQLAECEMVPAGSTFIRKGAPDAGVECYWKLNTGKEWGWQAKFFLSSPGDDQWNQIDKSAKSALEKHPELEQYIICIPLDRQDPRKEKEEWFMDKWNDHVGKWQDWAKEKGMSVKFDYWGEHEIWERLSREVHRGRYYFWFNKDLFSHQWFENRINEAISNAGPRYTPELNVDLPLANNFEGLGRTSTFYDKIKIMYGEIKRAYLRHRWKYAQKFAEDELKSLDEHTAELFLLLQHIDRSNKELIDFSRIVSLSSSSNEIAHKCIQILRDVEEKKLDKGEDQRKTEDYVSYNPTDKVEYERYYFNDFVHKLDTIEEFALGNEALLANNPALLLVGSAGTGKTHLFCDIAQQRISKEAPTILMLGEHFKDEEPWSQIIRLLGLSCNKEDFLGALEASAQISCSRALILIDALNEGEGKKLWRKYLAGFLTFLSRYPRIGIAISVRSSYVDLLIPDGLLANNKLIKLEHTGFTDHEYQAIRTFFDHFGIERPNVPLMVPEFQNPLFLKLFCLGLKNRGLTKIPPGLQGITTIFDFFIGSVNERLSKLEFLDFDPKKKIVSKAIEKIAEAMAEENRRWLERENAQKLINAVLPTWS